MSLKKELAMSSSPITQYIRFVASIIANTGRDSPFPNVYKNILGLNTLEVNTVVAPEVGEDARTVGSAFDYRLRYYLAPCYYRDFVAWKGSEMLIQLDPKWKRQLETFYTNLDNFTTRISPAGCALDDADEVLLDTYCVVLAKLEVVFRSGGQWTPQHPPMHSDGMKIPKKEALLQIADLPSVMGVQRLSRSALTTFGPLIRLTSSSALSYHPNPKFEGSLDIGGADADFIIGDSIFELKTTKSFSGPAVRDALLQLIGYCLLDYSDEYEIRQLGLYFARQEWVVVWPLWCFVFPLIDVLHYNMTGTEPSEELVKQRLAKCRSLMGKVVNGQSIDYDNEFS
ncbi:MAG: hypothetical protein ACYCYO_23050 [Bacilli bacterium]